MVKKFDARKVRITNRSLIRIFDDITPKIPNIREADAETNYMRIVSHNETNPSDTRAEKADQLKKDEELERMMQLQIELDRQDAYKREK